MLRRPKDESIKAAVGDYRISEDVTLHAKVLRGKPRSGRKAIYVHGGGAGGNHTLIERPSRLLIEDGFFDEVILPDRRGDGASTSLTGKPTMREHAGDMKALLDTLRVEGPITALGISYGGPIALTLAYLDPRVERVVLVASSPTLKQTGAVAGFLVRTGILKTLGRFVYRRYVGKLPPAYTDFDAAYDAGSPRQLAKLYLESLRRTPADRVGSLVLNLESTVDPDNASIPDEVELEVPVLQVIGERDEVWGNALPDEYLRRFPDLKRTVVRGARKHKDVFFEAEGFYGALTELLRSSGAAPAERLAEASAASATEAGEYRR